MLADVPLEGYSAKTLEVFIWLGNYEMVEVVQSIDPVRVKSICKWFNEEKGYGFLIAEGYNRDIFVHRQQLVRSGLQGLIEGEEVTCVVRDGSKGMYAVQISPFIKESKG